MSPGKIGGEAIVMACTDFYFLFCDGMLQRRLNEVELVGVAERMIIAYSAVILNDEDSVQVDMLRNRRKPGGLTSRHDFNVFTPERRDKFILQVPIGTVHILNVVESEFGHEPVLEGVKRTLNPAFPLG